MTHAADHFPDDDRIRRAVAQIELGSALVTVGLALVAFELAQRNGLGPEWAVPIFAFLTGAATVVCRPYGAQLETWRDVARLRLFVDDASGAGTVP